MITISSNKLTIVVEETRGVFLGVYSNYAMFSKNDAMESVDVCGFPNKQEAVDFMKKYLPLIEPTVSYVEIPSGGDSRVSAVDIIKAGYPQYTEELFFNMPTRETHH